MACEVRAPEGRRRRRFRPVGFGVRAVPGARRSRPRAAKVSVRPCPVPPGVRRPWGSRPRAAKASVRPSPVPPGVRCPRAGSRRPARRSRLFRPSPGRRSPRLRARSRDHRGLIDTLPGFPEASRLLQRLAVTVCTAVSHVLSITYLIEPTVVPLRLHRFGSLGCMQYVRTRPRRRSAHRGRPLRRRRRHRGAGRGRPGALI